MYNTKLLKSDDDGIKAAADLIKKGEVVGIPTETVYGLAADALNENAVAKIFSAKGRPADNPLIVHIAHYEDIYNYVTEVPDNAKRLAELFWPGPMTMVLPKKDIIPMITSGGLDTVGIRFPSDITARRIISASGCPIAAPSANISGSPSTTSAAHVMNDMSGKISAVVDGGASCVGVESTVISVSASGMITLLRPGFVTLEELRSAVGENNVILARGVKESMPENERAISPGMKYKHYSPKANVTIIKGNFESFVRYLGDHFTESSVAMVFNGEEKCCPYRCIAYGGSPEQQAQQLFSVLRSVDEMGIEQVFARCPEQNGVGLAVYNRLLRAAGFEVVET